jgi:PAS domain S-box-containing protein
MGKDNWLASSLEERTQDKQRYELALESINQGVYDWDITKDEIYVSPPLRVMMGLVGLSADELVTSSAWVNRIHPNDLPAYRNRLVAHFKGETPRFEADYRYRSGDGAWRWAQHQGIALRGADGRAYRMVGTTGRAKRLPDQSSFSSTLHCR